MAAASHATPAAVLIHHSTKTNVEVTIAATYRLKMSHVWAYFPILHRRLHPWDEPEQARHAVRVTETPKNVVCTPTTVPRLGSSISTRRYSIVYTHGVCLKVFCTDITGVGR